MKEGSALVVVEAGEYKVLQEGDFGSRSYPLKRAVADNVLSYQ